MLFLIPGRSRVIQTLIREIIHGIFGLYEFLLLPYMKQKNFPYFLGKVGASANNYAIPFWIWKPKTEAWCYQIAQNIKHFPFKICKQHKHPYIWKYYNESQGKIAVHMKISIWGFFWSDFIMVYLTFRTLLIRDTVKLGNKE